VTPRVTSILIDGYRPFRQLHMGLGALTVLVGANGTGKSALLEFLRFLREAVDREIPPEVINGASGRQLFHRPGGDEFSWALNVELGGRFTVTYAGALAGPVGRPRVVHEVAEALCLGVAAPMLARRDGSGETRSPTGEELISYAILKPGQLVLSTVTTPRQPKLYELRETILGWRFYGAHNINNDRVRRPMPVQQEPVLSEDCGNLSAVLHFMFTECRDAFDELVFHLRSLVPGLVGLSVKARGAPGEVIGIWREEGSAEELTLADLSDGTLRLLCWLAVCLHPKPPTLVCIDEPDQGVHPRTLPLLAGLLQKATERTQVLVTTHSSYFLLQFPLESIGVLRKADGQVGFFRPIDSATLMAMLEDFGPEELERMHRTDELEILA